MLIPADRHDEEPMILSKIRKGERVDHYETLRQRKDGSLIPISLTISPIRAADGTIVGASKIARDITEHAEAQEQQQLMRSEEHTSEHKSLMRSPFAVFCSKKEYIYKT